MMKTATIFAIALAAVACSADPPKSAAPPPKKAATPPRPAAGAAPATELTSNAPDVHKKALKDEDFVESATNRDPFHSFISELVSGPVKMQTDYFVYFDKYACEELKLIAVVTGGLDPRALFRDPGGMGIPLKVGDHLCKARWKIKRIVAEGVVVEVEQDNGGVKPKIVERMIPINPGEESTK
jgi:hypothetical protein